MATESKGRQFATRDGRLVNENDPEAAVLVAGEDGEVDQVLLDALKASAEPAAKASAKADDKAVTKSANK